MLKEEKLFAIEDLQTVVERNNQNYFVTVACPNYEERSIECLKAVNSYSTHKELMKYQILFLKNRRNNNLVLEELKSKYNEQLKAEITDQRSLTWYKIDYPNNFSSRGLITRLTRKLKKYSTERNIVLHIDISAMPGGIIFSLCEAILKWLRTDFIRIEKVFFSCVSPERFSQLPYAQEVGLLRGFFSGEPLSVGDQQDIRTAVFPSMTGHESKLLLDELHRMAHDQKNAILLQIDGNDFLTSMEIMRANQILMEQGESTQYYYCSLYDAINELLDYFSKEENERQAFSPESKRLYLVAPFGDKIMLPVSYFILKRLQDMQKRKKTEITLSEIEICYAQGFQYTSVYSIGVGETCTFSLKLKPKIKICDIRDIDTARFCAEQGVDFMGLHQIKAPLSPEKTKLFRDIKSVAGPTKLVLVTQEQDLNKLCEMCLAFQFDYIQMHFPVTADSIKEFKKQLRDAGCSSGLIAVIGAENIKEANIQKLYKEVDYLLFDSSFHGGTGECSTEDTVKEIIERSSGTEFFFAGGLTPDNVAEKIARVHPFAVDVQSGVETPQGEVKVKDRDKIAAFVRAVRTIP